MHSTLNPKQTDDPHDFLVVAPDIVLIAPADAEHSSLAPDAMRYPSDPQSHIGSDFSAGIAVPPVDTFRAAAVNNVQVPGERGSIGKSAVRAFTALLLAACLGLAAIAWQSSGNVAKQIIAKWAPKFILTSLLPSLENPGLPEQPSPPTVQVSAAKAAPPQPAPLAQTAPEGVAANAASAQLLHAMALDLATARQEIEAAQGKTNVPRHCQGFQAEPEAQDISASAAVGRRAGAQADAAISAPASCGSSHVAATGSTFRPPATRTI